MRGSGKHMDQFVGDHTAQRTSYKAVCPAEVRTPHRSAHLSYDPFAIDFAEWLHFTIRYPRERKGTEFVVKRGCGTEFARTSESDQDQIVRIEGSLAAN